MEKNGSMTNEEFEVIAKQDKGLDLKKIDELKSKKASLDKK